MAGQDEGDDFFSDDDLDKLPQNALDELENNAILFTQHQTQATEIINGPASSDYGDGFEDEDLDDAVVFDEAQGLPTRLQPLNSQIAGQATQREAFRRARYGGPSNLSQVVDRAVNKGLVHQDEPVQQATSKRQLSASFGQFAPEASVEVLQKQIQDLLRERDTLKEDLTIKAGEIAIVRGKHEKASKEHERELIAVKNLTSEKLAQQQQLIEEVKQKEKAYDSEMKFMQRELNEEAEKVRNLRRAKEKEREIGGEQIMTPKKNKTLAYRDGFDDDEIQIISPSKFHARRSNPSTPTKAGAKRKRKLQDSPTVELEVEHVNTPIESAQLPGIIANEELLERILRPDDRLQFLEMVLDHRLHRNGLRTIEEFAKIAFPSDPGVSFASVILGKLPTFNSKQSTSEFPIEFCELLTSLWRRSLDEKQYKPIQLLIDLLTFCLELKTLAVAPFILDTILPIAQETADLVAIPKFERNPYGHLVKEIDVSACLAIIYLIALGCINDKAHTTRFWKRMRLDFVLMVLSQQQAIEDFEVMLRLVSMSLMKESIGPIAGDAESQQEQTGYIVERVSIMLVNSPLVPEGSPALEPSVISNLHVQILRTLEAFCQNMWGGEMVAINPQLTNRLVRVMSNELDALYDYRSGHKQSARIVSLTTRLLHYLTTKHEKHINIQERLSKIHGGNQKYLLCLARLNFSTDDLVLDADIDPEVAECAHEMLELAVTPEEGDAIHSAFSSI